MIRRTPRTKPSDTIFPYTTLCRADAANSTRAQAEPGLARKFVEARERSGDVGDVVYPDVFPGELAGHRERHRDAVVAEAVDRAAAQDRKSTRLNSSH